MLMTIESFAHSPWIRLHKYIIFFYIPCTLRVSLFLRYSWSFVVAAVVCAWFADMLAVFRVCFLCVARVFVGVIAAVRRTHEPATGGATGSVGAGHRGRDTAVAEWTGWSVGWSFGRLVGYGSQTCQSKSPSPSKHSYAVFTEKTKTKNCESFNRL